MTWSKTEAAIISLSALLGFQLWVRSSEKTNRRVGQLRHTSTARKTAKPALAEIKKISLESRDAVVRPHRMARKMRRSVALRAIRRVICAKNVPDWCFISARACSALSCIRDALRLPISLLRAFLPAEYPAESVVAASRRARSKGNLRESRLI